MALLRRHSRRPPRAAQQCHRRGGPSQDTGCFDHFALLASDFDAVKGRLEAKSIAFRENHIAQPPIDQLFFPDNNNVMVELNFPR
jgi:hypothetical protein